jgi:hypothetical protein
MLTLKRTRTIAAALATGGMGLAGCKVAPAAVELTANDLSASANLTNPDRKVFTDQCFARRAELFANFTNEASIIRATLPTSCLELLDNASVPQVNRS